eukprot:1287871-Pyramimonas_sp.AAC.1
MGTGISIERIEGGIDGGGLKQLRDMMLNTTDLQQPCCYSNTAALHRVMRQEAVDQQGSRRGTSRRKHSTTSTINAARRGNDERDYNRRDDAIRQKSSGDHAQ